MQKQQSRRSLKMRLHLLDSTGLDVALCRCTLNADILFYYKIVHLVQNNEKIQKTIKNKGNMQ